MLAFQKYTQRIPTVKYVKICITLQPNIHIHALSKQNFPKYYFFVYFLLLGRKVMTNLDSILKKQRHYFANKGLSSQGYGFSSGHVWMWELDCEESWMPKNWCFWTVVLEKTLESPLDCKEIQPVHPKGDQSWVFIGRTDAEAETHAKSWLIWKDPAAGKDWGQEEKETTEDEIVGWHCWLNGHGFGWTLGVSDGQGGLACCRSWGHKESDKTEWLNWTDWMHTESWSFNLFFTVSFLAVFMIHWFYFTVHNTSLSVKTTILNNNSFVHCYCLVVSNSLQPHGL